MSKVVEFKEFGGPEVLEIVEKEVAAPGKGEVRFKVKAMGLNRAEAIFRRGKYFEVPVFPAKLGYEAAGIVDAVGPDVTDFKKGDAVSTVPSFAMNDYGVYGDMALSPASALVKHPESLTFEQAAAVWMAYLTAYDALVGQAKLQKGEFILIPAASSSVGIAAIQVSNYIGAIPVALTRTSEKVKQLKDIGAVHVIATEEQDLVAETQKITDGKGAQVVFDPVGGPTFAKLMEAAAPFARMLVYGTLSPEPIVLPHFSLFPKVLNISGAILLTTTLDPVKLKAGVEWVSQGLASGQLKPIIAKTFPLEQIVDAHRYLEENKQFGKIVVTV
jgi:NADPH:quinone reductase-like Zn-dependent oxidoreductase